jgi:cytochrome c556
MHQAIKPRFQFRSAVAAVAITMGAATIVSYAQPPAQPPAQPAAPGGNQSPAQPGAAPPAPRAAVPVAASSVGARPEAYFGQYVSLYGIVDQALSPTAFSVDQDKTKSTGQEVLVLAPRLHEPVELNTYVTVIGEVVRADSEEIAQKAKGSAAGLPPEILAKYSDRAVILATSVINASLVDLAKFMPPPMTPEEAAFDKVMKSVGAANGALRKGVDASNAELVKTNTAVLHKAFGETEAFWKARGKADAVKFAQTARGAVQAIDAAAGMGNWNEAKAQITTLGQQCQSCHAAFRERGEDGSFFIKPGSK